MVLLKARKVLSVESRLLSWLDLRLRPAGADLPWPVRPMRIAMEEKELCEPWG